MSDRNKGKDPRTKTQLLKEIEQLRLRLEEAEQTLEAIRHGAVDALVVAGPQGEQVFSLTGAEHIYRVIVETMNEAALTVDLDGTILFCNQRFCNLMKTSIQQVMGRKVTAFAARPQQAPLRAFLANAQAGPVQRRLTLRAADGADVPVQLAASLLQAGDSPSICLVATDLTELEESAHSIRVLREHQQALQESESRFRTIFESSGDAIVITDDEGVCVQANPAVRTIFGLPPEEIVGRRISDFVGEAVDFPAVWQAFRAAGSFRAEMPMTGADGQVRHVDSYSVANILPGGHLSVLRDITERKHAQEALQEANERLQTQAEELQVQTEELRAQAEELAAANAALRESEEKFRTLHAMSPIGIVLNRLDNGQFLESNQALWDMTGYTEEEFRSLTYWDITPIDYKDMEAKQLELLHTVGRYGPYEKEYLRKDGTRFPVLLSGVRIKDPRGTDLIYSVIQDMTELKARDQVMRESREDLNRAQGVARIGSWRLDIRHNVLLWSDETYRMFGVPQGTPMTYETFLTAVHPDDRQYVDRQWTAALHGEPYDIEHRIVVGDTVKWVRERAELEFDREGVLLGGFGTVQDISERKRAEEALRESEARYHRLFEDDLTGNFISTADGQILLCNPAFARIFGFASAPEAVGTHMLDLYLDATEREALLERLKQQRKIERLEVWRKRRDGEPIYLIENLVGHFNDQGELYEIKGYLFDDTERKRAAEALREAHEHARWLARFPQENPEPVLRVSADAIVLYRNAAAARLPGWQCEMGRPLTQETLRRLLADAIQDGRLVEEDVELGGTPFAVAVIPIPSEGYANFYGRDIAERKQAEEALRELNTTLESKVARRTAELEHRARQLQKLTLELSETEDRERRQLAEILHDDLQQQLAAAKFHLSLLSSRAKHDPSLRAMVSHVDQMLMEAIQKSRSLSHELSPAVLYHADFAAALGWLAGQVQAKHGLEVAVDAFSEIKVESESLKSFLFKAAQEMLFNVVKHARINKARIRVRRFGRCICLSVSDRGRGFDPQEVRQTAGFGLLSIRERVELLGGRMKMHSVPGQGSTFHVVVPDGPALGNVVGAGPRTRPTSGDARPGDAGLGDHGAGSHEGPRLRVVLADDHQIVREGLISLLSEAHDIEVVGEAANGREAINQAYRLRPDVVIMDVAMPLINGDDATRQIKLHLPQTRVIALSMYDEADLIEKMRRAGAEGYILKTAPSDQLLAAIRGKPTPP